MKIYLVRHGETSYNREKRAQGQIDIPLSDIGVEQAVLVGERLKDMKFDAIYSSDLSRASDTAKEIARHHDAKVVVDERLREKNFGIAEGKTREEIGWDGYLEDKLNYRFEGGESTIEHAARLTDFFDSLEHNEDDCILIVSHGGSIRHILPRLTGIDIMESHRTQYLTNNTCIYVVDYDADEEKGRLILSNDTEHLKNMKNNY